MDFRVHKAKDVGKTVAEAVAKCKRPIMEPKYDGWRCIIIRTEDGVDIYNRSQKKYNGQLPELEEDLRKLPVGTILDGELVALKFDIATATMDNDFYRIHTVMRSKPERIKASQRAGIKLVAFDCIKRAGNAFTFEYMLPTRRNVVRELIENYGLEMVELTMQMPATQANHDDLVKLGFEGSVIKDEEAPYAFGKSGHGWFKIKATTTIDCVISKIIMDGRGQFEGQAGRMVASQYSVDEHRMIERCRVNCPNNSDRCAMTDNPDAFVGRVAEIKVYGWSDDGNPRHPTFLRWREDKPASECVYSNV